MVYGRGKGFTKVIAVSVAALVLGSCGKARLENATINEPRELYVFSGGSGSGLYGVDLNDSEFRVQTLEENGVTWPRLLSTTDLTASGLRVGKEQFVVYVKDLALWKINASPGAELTPQRVSSTDNTNVCDAKNLSTGLRALDSLFLFETAGQDGQCVKNEVGDVLDNRRYAIRLGLPEETATIDITEKTSSIKAVKILSNPSNLVAGATDILTKNKSSLMRYAMNWGDPAKIAETTTVYTVLFEGTAAQGDGTFVRLDNNLHWYDRPAQKVTPALFTPSHSSMRYDLTCEEGNRFCYIVTAQMTSVSPNIGPPLIYSTKVLTIPADGSGGSTDYSTEIANYASIPLSRYQLGYTLARDYFYVFMFPNGGHNWFRYPKKGIPPVVPEKVETISALSGFTLGENIYFNGYIQARYAAQVLNQDGTRGKIFKDAQWVMMDTLTPHGIRWIPSVLVSKISGMMDYKDAELSVFDVNDNSPGVVLGVLPKGTIGLHGKHVGEHSVVFGLTYGDTATLNNRYDDIFIADTRRPNSLRRLTNTPKINEMIL